MRRVHNHTPIQHIARVKQYPGVGFTNCLRCQQEIPHNTYLCMPCWSVATPHEKEYSQNLLHSCFENGTNSVQYFRKEMERI